MRVFLLLSLLCLSVLGVSGQYVVGGTNLSTQQWGFSAPAAIVGLNNPTLNFTAGNTYTFDVSVASSHPFNFSGANTGLTLTALNTTWYTVSATGCTGTNGYTGNGCIVSLTINPTAPNGTLWYQCTNHLPMTGQINIWANASAAAGNATTVAPTTAAPTTVAPTNNTGNATTIAPTTLAPTTVAPTNNTNATTVAPTTGAPTTNAPTTGAPTTPAPTTGTIASNSFRITGNAGTNAWIFTAANGVQYANPTLTVTAGSAVTFSFELPNSPSHPFGFSNNSSPTLAPTQLNDTTVFPDALQTYTTTTCVTNYFTNIKTVHANANTTCTITVPAAQVNAGTLYYRCARHPLMVGTINVVAAPSSSSTGGNSASTIALSGLTIVFAMIVAMMA